MSLHSAIDVSTNRDEDDIIELDAAEAGQLAGGDTVAVSSSNNSPVPTCIEEDDDEDTVIINGTSRSVGDSADANENFSQETAVNHDDSKLARIELSKSPVVINNNRDHQQKVKDPGLVMIDTNDLLAGKGSVPLKSSTSSTKGRSVQQGADSSTSNIPDDARMAQPTPGLIRTMPKESSNSMLDPQLQRGMQLTQQQFLQPAISGHITLPSGISAQALEGFLMKADFNPNRMSGSSSILRKSASHQARKTKSRNQPSVSTTHLSRHQGGYVTVYSATQVRAEAKQRGGKTSFVKCEICDSYIKGLDQLRNHMQWIHDIKISTKMIYKKAPLNCEKCKCRYLTDHGLERHLLGLHGLVSSFMQDAANKGLDGGKCPLCRKVFKSELLAHVANEHRMPLRPAHLFYKCTICTEIFGMYKLFENHMYSAHSGVVGNASRGNNTERRPGQASSRNSMGSQTQIRSRSKSSVASQIRGQQDDKGIKNYDSPKHDERSLEQGVFKTSHVCGTEGSSDESYSRGIPEKRICLD